MVHTIRAYREGQRQLSKLVALKRGVTRMARNFEVDGSQVIELLDRQIACLSAEIERFNESSNRRTYDSSVLAALREAPSGLIQARIALGWSQTEMAKRCGLAAQQVYRYEKTKYALIKFSKAIEIAQVLKNELDQQEELANRYQLRSAPIEFESEHCRLLATSTEH